MTKKIFITEEHSIICDDKDFGLLNMFRYAIIKNRGFYNAVTIVNGRLIRASYLLFNTRNIRFKNDSHLDLRRENVLSGIKAMRKNISPISVIWGNDMSDDNNFQERK